jgi:hypothetical protein
MKTTTFELINGTFSAEEGKDIILNLLNHKIHFHTVRSLSYWEKTGNKDNESLKRLGELKATRENFLKLFDDPNFNAKNLSVASLIQIDLVQ